LTRFANPVPGNQVLPASFYLASKPSFFGANPWPGIGPDVAASGVNAISNVGGYAWKNPAMLKWEGMSDDLNYAQDVSGFRPKVFDGVYSESPSPPSGTPVLSVR
jgi:hypothetical protein